MIDMVSMRELEANNGHVPKLVKLSETHRWRASMEIRKYKKGTLKIVERMKILELYEEGKTEQEIADKLERTVTTVHWFLLKNR